MKSSTMGRVRVTVAAKTDVGRVRTSNEDSFTVFDVSSNTAPDVTSQDQRLSVSDGGLLLALSDGMGGHQAGEVASKIVVDSLRAALREPSDAPTVRRIERAAERANLDVVDAAKSGDKKGMGATLTALFVHGAEAYIAQVGDSRAYLLRAGRLRQLSRDQSLVQLLIDGGAMTAEQAKNAPHKNVILQAMGQSRDVRAAVSRLELRDEDTVLLCCDGLSNAISDDEIRDLLASPSPLEACNRAIALANERGGKDNLTAIVARFDGESLGPPDLRVTATFEVLADFTVAPPPPRPVPSKPPPADVPRERAPADVAKPPPADVAKPPPADTHGRPARIALIVAIAVAIAAAAVIAFFLRRGR